ncbi:1-deoxy-D-xylulose-5-phosphate reductoisomerase [Parvibacter caecicola]|uniref:1-deoxy-D-xylulose 5-phosphate reductoisomerase n=1 Tax=Parvibacter caecicola TaxID=747645 RepID=A0A7W5GQ88_9ACTN|nr:1-deoxy-D-xylulose-5-phosphate reductoisomerase [Parvibacter caecicola]MBB3172065.1 1-deoxy-D-xylulose-5-phosphate reductoisomerase [Parvibacter caecicola]MCR2041894.1 1-deoxy-D-xylulose-5-phosphate reductoisomerase [Parvibacter caecicola]RNL11330.1 1-deoxy-D-xylulose-5-phosphate reductoisomerase [Parvibacter caecicola]
MKTICLLGSTGSIGTQTLDVVAKHPDELRCAALTVHRSVKVALDQARRFGVRHVAVADERLAGTAAAEELRAWCEAGGGTLSFGAAAVEQLCLLPEMDVVVNALVGAAGLRASYLTLEAGRVLALANKESLVVGGDLIMPLAASLNRRRGDNGALMPIDSEHGAIYQCLLGEDMAEVTKLWVTASGGPFRGRTRDQLRSITPAQALAHPTWNMGAKISIDSSTLMNKGLEVIEAHHLFAMPYDKIEVVVQPQSAIHSMVEFSDGSVKAHLGTTDMRIPIQFALSYPKRWEAPVAPLDFRTLGTLEFAAPDTDTFRCLALARRAGQAGGTLPCVMNAANEVAVEAFLSERLPYLGIAECVESAMSALGSQPVESLEQLSAIDHEARALAWQFVEQR